MRFLSTCGLMTRESYSGIQKLFKELAPRYRDRERREGTSCLCSLDCLEKLSEKGLEWSLWRRAHQAVARRCHRAHRAFHPESAPSSSCVSRQVAMEARSIVPEPRIELLTDVAWELVKPLMPPQKPPSGRPRRQHRTMLGGMLWVLGTGSLWRDLPEEEYGP